jgi:hypothetical protein
LDVYCFDGNLGIVAAEYLAKGYTLSDQVLAKMIELDSTYSSSSFLIVYSFKILAKQGISQRFLSYMKSLDSTVGAKALGPDQTVSAKIQETVAAATQHAKTVDEQKGFSKTAGDVRFVDS